MAAVGNAPDGAIHTPARPCAGGQEQWDADEEVRLQQASSWQYSGEGEAAQEDPMAIDIGLRLQQNTAQASAKNLV